MPASHCSTPAFCIEGGVIELAARSIRYGNGSDCFQRHDSPVAPCVALVAIWSGDNGKPVLASSTRNLLEGRELRRAWTETV
jgi:hypothetical protein